MVVEVTPDTFACTSTPVKGGSNGVVGQQQAGDELGFSVLLPADGTILAVGAGVANRVHDYQWMSNTWEPLGSTLDGEGGGDGFEFSLALSDDGIHFGRGSPV